MKKFVLSAICACAMVSAQAVYMLPTPKITDATVADGKLNLKWDANNTTNDRITHFHVIVYKTHKATQAETFTLAQSDFSSIVSTGTMTKHEERGAIWDYLPDNPGWYVKTPVYMNQAMGIDAINNFAGSDNSDIFGGAYMVSPDYNVYGLTDPTLHISASLAKEGESVSGGFALYTWSEEWWNEENYDYKPVEGHDHNYSDISTTGFQDYSEECTPEVFLDRVRVCFYGNGSSALWINNFKVDVQMQPNDFVRYAADLHEVQALNGENTLSIDLNDTDTDYIYGVQLRTVLKEEDSYRNVTTVRFLSPMTDLKILDASAAIDNIAADAKDAVISVKDGAIFVEGDASLAVDVFTPAGQKVMSGVAGQPIVPGNGLFIVKAGNAAAKVNIR